jgi:hypothetical protein
VEGGEHLGEEAIGPKDVGVVGEAHSDLDDPGHAVAVWFALVLRHDAVGDEDAVVWKLQKRGPPSARASQAGVSSQSRSSPAGGTSRGTNSSVDRFRTPQLNFARDSIVTVSG